MDTKKLIGLCLSIGFFAGVVFACSLSHIFRNNYHPEAVWTITEEDVFAGVNSYRLDSGKEPFEKSDRLCDWGKIRLYEVKRDWSHNGFASSRFCRLEDGEGCAIGEVLGKGQTDSSRAVQLWLESESHKEILDGDYELGCIIFEDGYVVGEFASFWE